MRLSGRNPVVERLRRNPSTVRRIYIQEGLNESSFFFQKAKQWNIPLLVVPRQQMDKMARGINSQGVLVEIDEFAYADYHDILDLTLQKGYTPVYFDGMTDPQNLGAIIRTLGCMGKFAIILPSHDSVEVTQAVLRVASGADNFVPVAIVSNINKAIREAKKEGVTIAGAVVKDGAPIQDASFEFPLGLVIGSEHKGIREIILPNLDVKVTIPMYVDTLSLNVAQATTIFAYEITKQKKQKKRT